MIDLYQSMRPEFRYGDGKVLGTQLHLTRKSTSIYCVSNPKPIKGSSNMLILYQEMH